MTRRLVMWAAMMVSAVTVSACMADGGAASDPRTESTATSELSTARFCFTCDIDPSVHSCSSIESHAQHVCQRACIVCDDFGDNIGECFSGICEPDL